MCGTLSRGPRTELTARISPSDAHGLGLGTTELCSRSGSSGMFGIGSGPVMICRYTCGRAAHHARTSGWSLAAASEPRFASTAEGEGTGKRSEHKGQCGLNRDGAKKERKPHHHSHQRPAVRLKRRGQWSFTPVTSARFALSL